MRVRASGRQCNLCSWFQMLALLHVTCSSACPKFFDWEAPQIEVLETSLAVNLFDVSRATSDREKAFLSFLDLLAWLKAPIVNKCRTRNIRGASMRNKRSLSFFSSVPFTKLLLFIAIIACLSILFTATHTHSSQTTTLNVKSTKLQSIHPSSIELLSSHMLHPFAGVVMNTRYHFEMVPQLFHILFTALNYDIIILGYIHENWMDSQRVQVLSQLMRVVYPSKRLFHAKSIRDFIEVLPKMNHMAFTTWSRYTGKETLDLLKMIIDYGKRGHPTPRIFIWKIPFFSRHLAAATHVSGLEFKLRPVERKPWRRKKKRNSSFFFPFYAPMNCHGLEQKIVEIIRIDIALWLVSKISIKL